MADGADTAPAILLVDDDRTHARLIRAELEDVGWTCQVRTAQNRDQVLEQLEQAPRLDLVLLSASLPGAPVRRVLEDLKTRSGLPVVLMAREDEAEVLLGEACQMADAFEPKPVDPARLQALLQRFGSG